MSQGAQLKDMINYVPEQYFTDEELKLVRRTFKDNPQLIKVLRKILVPTISDPELPVEEFQKDFFIAGKSWAQVPDAERSSMILARQEAIEFVIGGLIYLKTIANQKEESEEEKQERKRKDSTK